MKAVPKASPLVYLLVAAAIGLIVAMYHAPIWWVSLTAPNYPEEAFPDGVRINFHMNGVFNGCAKVESDEIQEDEALDCVHEMDTINHYVGMYPIAAGGVIERAFSPFLVGMLVVMLVGFATPIPKARMALMGAGFIALGGWLGLTWYAEDGLRYQSAGYLEAMVSALDQDAGGGSGNEPSAAQALIKRMKAELEKSGVVIEESKAEAQAPKSAKEQSLEHLRVTYEKDANRTDRSEWRGSGSQLLSWHYEKSLGRYFKNPEEIGPMVKTMTGFAHVVFWGLLAAMALLVWGARRNGGLLYWLLVLAPLALPVFFLVDYSAWLWWYGHSLNDMGAFSVKPFMPTVFGQGKVAQFATHSYPSIGFGLMMGSSLLLAVAALLRRKEWKGLTHPQ